MKENEFDIQVRNLLQNAEEPVSPHVWEGIAAGLDGKRRRVVPLWVWRTAAGVAVAAAVAAGVVFLKPAATLIEEHSNPIITIAEAPATVAETPVVAAEQEPARLAAHRAVPAKPAPVQEEAPVVEAVPVQAVPVQEAPEQKAPAQKKQGKTVVPVQIDPAQDAQAQFNLLAQAEDRPASGRGFSLTASGNLQGLRRSSVGGGFTRPYSAPAATAGEGIYNESPEVGFSLPFSAGIGLKYNFTPRWGVGIGVRYTNLSRTFVGDYVGAGFRELQTDIDNHQHWIGIPVHLYYDIVNKGRWRVHAFAGASAEFLADNDFLIHGSSKDYHYHQAGTRPQWSGDLGLGVEFRITPVLGLYLDPSFRYFFRTDLQPRSIRTIQPLRFDLEAGLRFSFGN